MNIVDALKEEHVTEIINYYFVKNRDHYRALIDGVGEISAIHAIREATIVGVVMDGGYLSVGPWIGKFPFTRDISDEYPSGHIEYIELGTMLDRLRIGNKGVSIMIELVNIK